MTRLQAVRLVAGREIVTRVRSRAFLISTAIIAAGLVAVALLTGGSSGPKTYDVAGVGPRGVATVAAAKGTAPAFGARLDVHGAASDAAARSALRDGKLDAAALSAGRIAVKDDRSSTAARILQAGAARARSLAALHRSGVPPAAQRAVLDPPRPAVVTVHGRERSAGDQALAFIGALILYVALLISGYAVSSGVVEEKQSRVVELVVAVVRPTDLLTGKVLGIGAVSVGQLVAVAGVGVIA
ncbi:MAG TPA: ABC transporter permease, partial [Solirubrobacteraceae bacterium]